MNRRHTAIAVLAIGTLVVLALALGVGSAQSQAPALDEAAALQSQTFTAVADAYIRSLHADARFGKADSLVLLYSSFPPMGCRVRSIGFIG